MPRATCRCGQLLNLPDDGSDRLVCPKCGARVRIRLRRDDAVQSDDGFIRFFCSCGRRLKVPANEPPTHGKCPDCGRVVPVPATSTNDKPPGHHDADTVNLDSTQLAGLKDWASNHGVRSPGPGDEGRLDTPPVVIVPRGSAPLARAEAGFRVCPNCRKPVHLGADVCRACGTAVPRK